MPRFAAFNVVAVKEGSRHRIVKVMFGRDGTIYAMFPSFAHNEGFVARVTMHARQTFPTTINVPDWGKVAGHAVKYSHHPDGRAHFSQTGRIRTEIKKQASPLATQEGHLFTVQVQDLRAFGPPKTSTTPELTLNVTGDVHGIKLVFWRYKIARIQFPDPSATMKGPIQLQSPDGTMRAGLLVAPPVGAKFDDYALLVAPEDWKNEDTTPCLSFVGGFDPSEIAYDHQKDTSFLAFLYPCSDPKTFRARLGTVDL